MGTNIGQVMTLANSIIGVSVLAMPFCFKQCGILLSVLLLFLSSILSRFACRFLLQSAIITRRRNYEFLAFHVFGSSGKLCVELAIIGFLLGTCIAFFVVLGDLGPAISSSMFGLQHSDTLRSTILIVVALLVVLPLGLLRNVDSLSSICTATIAFYLCLVLKVMGEATIPLMMGDWLSQLNFWRPEGILQCLPIFSMALFCQTQLFEIFDSVPNGALDKMDSVVRMSVNMCTAVYISVGFFGYVAFSKENITGNILISLSESMSSEIIKLGFFLSVAASFPLVIFPCRASLYSLLYRNTQPPIHDIGVTHVPEGRFKLLTLGIVGFSLTVGLFLPNIEQVLGIIGSTIGVTICIIIPALLLMNTARHSKDKLSAQMILWTGAVIMILGTYAHILNSEHALAGEYEVAARPIDEAVDHRNEGPIQPINFDGHVLKFSDGVNKVEENIKAPSLDPVFKERDSLKYEERQKSPSEEKRKEPPVPVDAAEKPANQLIPAKNDKDSESIKKKKPKQKDALTQDVKTGEIRHEPPVPVEGWEKPKNEFLLPTDRKPAGKPAERLYANEKDRRNEKSPVALEKDTKLASVEPMDSVVAAPENILAEVDASKVGRKKKKESIDLVNKPEMLVPGGEQVNQDAIRHEEVELALEGKKVGAVNNYKANEKETLDTKKKSEEQDLLKTLKEHQEVQRDMLHEQQKILQELKKHELGHQASANKDSAEKQPEPSDMNENSRLKIDNVPPKIHQSTPISVKSKERKDSISPDLQPPVVDNNHNKTSIGKRSFVHENPMAVDQKLVSETNEGKENFIKSDIASNIVKKPIIMPLPLAYKVSSQTPPKQPAGRDILESQHYLDREKRDIDDIPKQGTGSDLLKAQEEHISGVQLLEDKDKECTRKPKIESHPKETLISKDLALIPPMNINGHDGEEIDEKHLKFSKELNLNSAGIKAESQISASEKNGAAPAMELKTPASISEPQFEMNPNFGSHVDMIGLAANAAAPTKDVNSKTVEESP